MNDKSTANQAYNDKSNGSDISWISQLGCPGHGSRHIGSEWRDDAGSPTDERPEQKRSRSYEQAVGHAES